MFDDARFYNSLAQDSQSYGRARCADSAMYIAISALDFADDLLDAMENSGAYLLDDESVDLAA